MKIEDFKILSKIGSGNEGTIFKCLNKVNNVEYAYKIEKILEERVKTINKTNNPIYRELHFIDTVASKYPDYFMQLYYYWIDDKCDYYNHESSSTDNDSLNNSNYCIIKIYSLVDAILPDIVNKLNTKQRYSIIIQLSYIIYLLTKHKYIHGDLHIRNIGVKYVDKNKKQDIFGNMVPLYGYQIVIIDYGNVLNKKHIDKKNKKEKSKYSSLFKEQLWRSLSNICYSDKFFSTVKWQNFNVTKFVSLCKKAKWLNNSTFRKIKCFDAKLIYALVSKYSNMIQKIYLNSCGQEYKKEYPIKLYLPLEDFYIILSNSVCDSEVKIKKITKIFIDKLT